MNYDIEFWGVQASGDKFHEVFRNKSPKKKNWLPKMRDRFGDKIDFDKVVDFGFRITPTKDVEK